MIPLLKMVLAFSVDGNEVESRVILKVCDHLQRQYICIYVVAVLVLLKGVTLSGQHNNDTAFEIS